MSQEKKNDWPTTTSTWPSRDALDWTKRQASEAITYYEWRSVLFHSPEE
jgi:hypothetical protein